MSRWLFVLFLKFCVISDSSTIASKDLIHSARHELFELPIVHINDFHARFEQTSLASSACRRGKEDQCIGGLARVSTVSRQILQERPNAIFLNAGDNFQGTTWYNIFKWNVTAYFMNKLAVDAITVGNHEFDDGIAGLVPYLQRIRAPIVVSNIDDSQEPTMQGLYKNSTIIVRDNHEIGVIGLIIQKVNTSSTIGQLKFLDEVESVNAEAKRLKAKGVNIIIVLSHVGLDVDRIIAAQCPDVDVIVGGHSHTLLYSGNPSPSGDVAKDEYPVVVKQKSTNRTVLIVQASAYTRYLGNLTVWFDQHGEVTDWEGNPIFLNSSIEQDPEMLQEMEPWRKLVEAVNNEIVGETRSFLNGSCKESECNMAHLITDSMVHWYRNKSENPEHWTYASIACINSEGIKANISVGNITFDDLSEVLTFKDIWDVVELKGEDLQGVLEESVSQNSVHDKFGILHWSGIKVVYNMSMPAWSRVQNLSVRCQACKEPKYEPLNHEKWYRLVARKFVIDGGDGLNVIADKHRNRRTGPLVMSAFEDYVRFISPFSYELEPRAVFIE